MSILNRTREPEIPLARHRNIRCGACETTVNATYVDGRNVCGMCDAPVSTTAGTELVPLPPQPPRPVFGGAA